MMRKKANDVQPVTPKPPDDEDDPALAAALDEVREAWGEQERLDAVEAQRRADDAARNAEAARRAELGYSFTGAAASWDDDAFAHVFGAPPQQHAERLVLEVEALVEQARELSSRWGGMGPVGAAQLVEEARGKAGQLTWLLQEVPEIEEKWPVRMNALLEDLSGAAMTRPV